MTLSHSVFLTYVHLLNYINKTNDREQALFLFFIQNICEGEESGETGALVHPGLQGSCGDLVFLAARSKTEKKMKCQISAVGT